LAIGGVPHADTGHIGDGVISTHFSSKMRTNSKNWLELLLTPAAFDLPPEGDGDERVREEEIAGPVGAILPEQG
jgi:hypothetical protein